MPTDLCVLTDRGSEYCGNPERHAYELYLAVEDIDHSRTKTKSPQTTDVIDKSFFGEPHCAHEAHGRAAKSRTRGASYAAQPLSSFLLAAFSIGILTEFIGQTLPSRPLEFC